MMLNGCGSLAVAKVAGAPEPALNLAGPCKAPARGATPAAPDEVTAGLWLEQAASRRPTPERAAVTISVVRSASGVRASGIRRARALARAERAGRSMQLGRTGGPNGCAIGGIDRRCRSRRAPRSRQAGQPVRMWL